MRRSEQVHQTFDDHRITPTYSTEPLCNPESLGYRLSKLSIKDNDDSNRDLPADLNQFQTTVFLFDAKKPQARTYDEFMRDQMGLSREGDGTKVVEKTSSNCNFEVKRLH